MTEIQPASWLHNAGAVHTAAQIRASVGSLVGPARASASLTSRGGVAPGLGGMYAVTQVGAGAMAVDIASGIVHVAGTATGTQGTYVCINDGTVQLAVTAADGTNPRLDAVVATVRDSFYSGLNDDWLLQIVDGTPAPVPVLPTLPDHSLLLAEISVAAGVTEILQADITDRRFFLGTGVITVADDTERDAIAAPYESLPVWNRSVKEVQVYNGTDWNRVRRPERIVYTSDGTFDKANFPGMVGVDVECQGAGAGGMGAAATSAGEGSCGGGGGGGAYARSFIDVDFLPTSVAVTVGAGGAGGSSDLSGSGASGGDSSFGSLVVAEGGFGAFLSSGAGTTFSMRATGGVGGRVAGCTGDFILPGDSGTYGIRFGDGDSTSAGSGGGSYLGGSTQGDTFNGSALHGPGRQYGGGGGGAAVLNSAGGAAENGYNGGDGVVIVTVHYM